MKTLIAYASKYGTTQQCAAELKAKLAGEVTLLNLGKEKCGDLSGYDQILIGTSVYMGRIQKTVKAFLSKNEQALQSKPFGIFFCCGSAESIDKALELSVSKELVAKAKLISYFGGEMNPDKMRGIHKFIIKKITESTIKEGKKLPELDFLKIESFAKEFA